MTRADMMPHPAADNTHDEAGPMRLARCPYCNLEVRRLVDVRNQGHPGAVLMVEPEPWVDESGREHWTTHVCPTPAMDTSGAVNVPTGWRI